jgi:alpha-galactosidase
MRGSASAVARLLLTVTVTVALAGWARGSPLWPELAATPPMGWNGWLPTTRGLIPGYSNNETMYYAAADQLVSSGLRDAGYDTVLVTCGGWQRDNATGKLVENPVLWPRGYKAFIDYLHARKLKIGAYGDTGEFNCCRMCVDGHCWQEPGQLGHEELDVQTWADWGVDHIVIDNCYNPNSTAQSVFEYRKIRDALVKVGKPMIYGIWDVGSGKPWAWAPDTGHYWRTGPDLGTRWGTFDSGGNDRHMSLMLNYDLQQAIPSLDSISGPGSFAFLDNLAVGACVEEKTPPFFCDRMQFSYAGTHLMFVPSLSWQNDHAA